MDTSGVGRRGLVVIVMVESYSGNHMLDVVGD